MKMISERYSRARKTHPEFGLAPTHGLQSPLSKKEDMSWAAAFISFCFLTTTLISCLLFLTPWLPRRDEPQHASQNILPIPQVAFIGYFVTVMRNTSETMNKLNPIILRKWIIINKGFRSVPNLKNLLRYYIIISIFLAQRDEQRR